MLHYLFTEYAFRIRQSASFLLIAGGILFFALIFSFVYVQYQPDAVYFLYGENQVLMFKYMYDPEHIKLSSNSSEYTTRQFLFYIFNNCWIGIKIFLGGFILGLGALILLIYNGLSMGLLMGYLVDSGYSQTLWPTIIGHSSFELIATLISATAGFKLGWSFIGPVRSRIPRLQHVIREFKQSLFLMYGALILFTIAGLIEAFWSSNNAIGDNAKYIAGISLWILLPTYLWLAGRRPATKP